MVTDPWFRVREGAALLKHEILRQYVPKFAGATGSRGEPVHYVDGYAGPGSYEDGEPGSPELVLHVAEGMAPGTDLRPTFIERNPTSAEQLQRRVDERGVPATVIEGAVEDKLEASVQASGQHPLLVFLDPYGLAVPLDVLDRVLLQRPERVGWNRMGKTEVIVHFSLEGLRRTAGRLIEDAEGDETRERSRRSTVEGLDAFLGGTWWHAIRRRHEEGWETQILQHYLRNLRSAGDRWLTYAAPVAPAPGRPAAYWLILVSQTPYAQWWFNEYVAKAREAWVDRFAVDAEPTLFQVELMDDDHDFLAPVKYDDERLVAVVMKNARRLLATRGEFTPMYDIHELLDGVIGIARTPQTREAIKRLHRAGEVEHDGKGDICGATVRRA